MVQLQKSLPVWLQTQIFPLRACAISSALLLYIQSVFLLGLAKEKVILKKDFKVDCEMIMIINQYIQLRHNSTPKETLPHFLIHPIQQNYQPSLLRINEIKIQYSLSKLEHIQNMSVGFPIDITRLLGDNQRFQRDLNLTHQQLQQLRMQLDQAQAANQGLRNHCEQLERQKQEEFQRFLGTHRELYQNEIATLRTEREQMIEELQKYQQSQQNPKFEELISKLREEIKKHEEEKIGLELDLTELKELMNEQQTQAHQSLQNELQAKMAQISALERSNSQEAAHRQILQKKIHSLESQRLFYQETNANLKQKVESLEQQWKGFTNNTSAGIIEELISLRKENLALKNQVSTKYLDAYSNDEEVYTMIKKMHEELAVLRYENIENKNLQSEAHISLQHEKSRAQQEKAEYELTILKLQKEVTLLRNQEKNYRESLEKVEGKLNNQAESLSQMQKLQEQAAILRIKVFVLQSLRNSEKYRRQDYLDYSQVQSQADYLSAFKFKSHRADVVKSVAAMSSAMNQTIDRLKQQETKRRDVNRKAKDYKSRWENLCKRQSQLLKFVERSKQKEEEYQKLIEKLQEELEKALMANTEASDRQNRHLLITPYQQKIQIMSNEIVVLQNQVKYNENTIQIQKRNHKKEIELLHSEIAHLTENNNQLTNKNRNLQTQILQQALSFASSKGSKNLQNELTDKTTAIIQAEQQLKSLREQLSNEQDIKQQQTQTIHELQKEMASLKQKSSQPSSVQHEINYLQQKLAYLQGVLGDQHTTINDNHFRTLYQEIAQLKQESNEMRQNRDRSGKNYDAELQIQSYRTRLMELQDALRGIAHENEEKNLEIFRLNEENHLLSKQLDKVEDELDVLRGKASSMREFDLLDRNKQLEEQHQHTQQELSKALESLSLKNDEIQAMRKQCDGYWSDNLKLLLIIKENNVQIKEGKYLSEKYDEQINIRQQQLENKVQSLNNENGILKNLVEDLRKTILDKRSSKEIQEYSRRSDNEAIKYELEDREREIVYLKEELQRLVDERAKEKELFDLQWNKIVSQLNQVKSRLEKPRDSEEKSPKKDEDSRINILSSQKGETEEFIFNNYRKKIDQLQAAIDEKNEKIDYLEIELRQYKYAMKSSGFYNQELTDLRNQVQNLLEGKFILEDKLRTLQQENSLLKIHKISQQPAQTRTFSQETFGPSFGTSHLIQNLRESQKEIPDMQSSKELWRDRYEQTLCLLVISWAQIESLRSLIQQIEQKSSNLYSQYTERLHSIQHSLKSDETIDVNLDLIHKLQCGHRHLLQLTQNKYKQGNLTLGHLGTFTESITGGKLIESYSVREENESIGSQQMMNL